MVQIHQDSHEEGMTKLIPQQVIKWLPELFALCIAFFFTLTTLEGPKGTCLCRCNKLHHRHYILNAHMHLKSYYYVDEGFEAIITESIL